MAADGLSPFELQQFRGSKSIESVAKYVHLMGAQYRGKIRAG